MELLLPTCIAAATVFSSVQCCSYITTLFSNADSLLLLLKLLLSHFVLVGLWVCELGRNTDKPLKIRKMGGQQNGLECNVFSLCHPALLCNL